MYPILFTIPGIDYPISSFGVMMALGFLAAYWLVVRELPNKGIDVFIEKTLPMLAGKARCLVVNIAGDCSADFAEMAGQLDGLEGIDALELNISCPNVKKGGMQFGIDPELTREVVGAARRAAARRPLMVKLSPNVTDIVALARAAAEAGADALSVANTWTGMAIDLEARRSRLGQPTGGLSGPAIKPLALRMVWEVARAVRVPVIGLGGIATGADVLEFLVAGARAVQVGTANFVQPSAAVRILEEVENYCRKNRIAKVTELCGTLKTDTEKRS